MPQCPICGREFRYLVVAEIEGAKIEVCEYCAKEFGKIIAYPTKEKIKQLAKLPKSEKTLEEEEYELVENYGEVISEARKKLNLSIEELAKKIAERESVLRKVEREELVPDRKLAEKLEKFLGIKLYVKAQNTTIPKKELKSTSLTIGDVVEIK